MQVFIFSLLFSYMHLIFEVDLMSHDDTFPLVDSTGKKTVLVLREAELSFLALGPDTIA